MASSPFNNAKTFYFLSLCIYFFTDEHDAVQRKTFTKWINARFTKVKIYLPLNCKVRPNMLKP